MASVKTEENVFIVIYDVTTSHAKVSKKKKSFFNYRVRAQRSRTEKVFTQVKIAAVNNGISPMLGSGQTTYVLK